MEKRIFYRKLLDSMDDGIYFVDTEREITFWNRGAERITGFPAGEVLGRFCYDNILNHVDDAGRNLCFSGCPLHASLTDGKEREAEVYLQHKLGHRVPVSIKVIPIREQGKIIGAVEIFTDKAPARRILDDLEKLKTLALQDQLTGLPNRRKTEDFLEERMKDYRDFGIPFGVAFMDIDRFKNFNDTYGHDVGDEILVMISSVLREAVRSSDLVGRWGGEEFIGVFPGVDEESLGKISEKIRMLVENSSLRNKENLLKVTISLGVSLVREEDDRDALVKRADNLLYRSKKDGRNRVTMG